eukprot:CAMPEP_0201938152 /NCGR_PEP_ID=MMETSP0903-20130614/40870_1 /ASSEMBLY_ACC=CAM_ASM_000552 /TAXON_ID=420261 /ORGANISM="Thalassiosira antarctica, Strain CCMP982" /LENGTH=602 /DNA_ID=CAMNT_0048479347 /DNA_START=11 /DNA_END=1816 /DNA_ORIENTATION=-
MAEESYKFAVVPKSINNLFFLDVKEGCIDGASRLGNVECFFGGTEEEDPVAQAEFINLLIDSGEYDGLALAVIDAGLAAEVIAKARQTGMSVVTFDSDSPKSMRQAYIGTNNTAFGDHLGKVLLQINPMGGVYGIISGAGPNLKERERGLRTRLAGSKWIETKVGSPTDSRDSSAVALDQMFEFAARPEIDTVIPVGGWPMFNGTGWKHFINSEPNRFKTLVSADATQTQLDLLTKKYVDGLVGQLPYEMGLQSMDVLYNLRRGEDTPNAIFGTNILQLLSVPLMLPTLNINMNYLGNLVIFGYTCFSIIAALSVGFAIWTIVLRKKRVVRAAQPPFLLMILVGTLIMGSSLITLGYDGENSTQYANDAACIATPWLLSIGFTVAFSALFSKTWRLNKVFDASRSFQRVVIEPQDVMLPFACILTANVVTLICWTVINPLQYIRSELPGTDDWNRIIATYGHCSSSDSGGGAAPYIAVLGVVNLTVIVIANYQAYRIRHASTEFQEARFILLINVIILQALILGVPMLFLVSSDPRGFYAVSTILISVICLSIILLMFVPKFYYHHLNSDIPTGNNVATTTGASRPNNRFTQNAPPETSAAI